MTQQPEALRLADAILTNKWPQVSPIWEASQELRRLHEVNAELLEALKWYVENDETSEGDEPLEAGLRITKGETWNSINAYWIEGLNKARAAINKAEGEMK